MRSGDGADPDAGGAVGWHPWLPLYLLLLLAATLFPFRAAHCAAPPWSLDFAARELLRNAVLFAPLGLAFPARRRARAVAAAAALSVSLEVIQGWLGRQPSVADVLANALGAGLGAHGSALVSRALPSALASSVLRAALCAGAVLLPASALVSVALREPRDFSNWERFALWIGNEATGDRPWNGELLELAIHDRASADLGREGAPPPWSAGGPVLWLRLEAPAALRLDGPDGAETLAPPTPPPSPRAGAAAAPWRMPARTAEHLFERLRATGRLSVHARIRSRPPTFAGLARIVSLSLDPLHRDFTLGQQGHDLRFRVRSPATGANGTQPEAVTHGAPLASREHRVEARYDGEVSRILVDGRCAGVALVAMESAPALLGRMLGATVVACTALGALAAAALCGALARSRWRDLAAIAVGGALPWLALWRGGAWSHLSGFEAGAVVLGLLALAAVAPLAARMRRVR